MAFHVFSEQKIKLIDVENIPPEFKDYYSNLTVQRKKEITALRPDLIAALYPSEQEEVEADTTGIPIIEKWEELSTLTWRKNIIDTTVLVCKVIPNDLRKCPVHRNTLLHKQLKYKVANDAVFNISGFFCQKCMDFFVEKSKIEKIAKNVAELGIPAWIQPYDITMAEWDAAIVPVTFNDDIPIYYTDSWPHGLTKCPIHNKRILEPERFQRTYKERKVIFDANICNDCNKILLSKVDAKKLERKCGENGIPRITFLPLVNNELNNTGRSSITVPDYTIQNGRKSVFQADRTFTYERLIEKDIVIVGDSHVCQMEGHVTYDDEVIIDVKTRRATICHCLTLLGYCSHCKKYYLDLDDYNRLTEIGRPEVTIIDETRDDSENTVKSGSAFEHEKEHLENVENELTNYVTEIKAKPDYIEKYATLPYGYDDGDLRWRKYKSEPYYQEIARITALRPKPYGYRVDFISGKNTIKYYLGIDDIRLKGDDSVLSFNSKEGRKLVNYRTTSIEKDGKRWNIHRRREFDIERENLFSFTDHTVGIDSSTSRVTDPFLVSVLKTRRTQHQLVEIISTIQENQDKIIDEPLSQNLIVQGCAGSGKTMVLLHRLSALKYDHSKSFDFAKTIILTPSKNFNMHIDGLAESLQVGIITRQSVEEYYNSLLREYSADLTLGTNIVDELQVDQGYVDYLYSDEFFQSFSTIYDRKIQFLKDLLDEINALSIQFGRKQNESETNTGEKIISAITQELTYNHDLMQQKEKEFETAQKNLKKHKESFERTTNLIPTFETRFHSNFLQETLAAGVKLSQEIDETSAKLLESQEELSRAEALRIKLHADTDKAEDELERVFQQTMLKVQQEIESNTGNIALQLKQINNGIEENYEERKRLSREKILADAEIETEIEKTRIECLTLLRDEENNLKEERSQINQQISEKKGEYASIDRRILITRKAERLRNIQQEIDILEQDKRQINEELSEVSQYILYNSIYTGKEDFYAFLSQVKSILPRVGELEYALSQREKKLKKLDLDLKDAEEKSEQLQLQYAQITKHAEELKARIPADYMQPTPDTFPDYLKTVEKLINEPSKYLDEIRPIRQKFRRCNDALTECETQISIAKGNVSDHQKRLEQLELVRNKLPETITEENCRDYVRIILPVLPSVRKHLTSLNTMLSNIKNSQDALIKIQEDIEKAQQMLELADKNRFSPDIQRKLTALEAQQNNLNAKSIFNEVFSSAIEEAGKRHGSWLSEANSKSSGIHRYDLYLRLRFAMKFYKKALGEENLICIDEGQDLCLNEYALLKEINRGEAVFNIYGDTNQLLKENRGISDWKQVRQLFKSSSMHELNENYRNTNQITQYCNDTFGMNVVLTGVDGKEVKQIDRIRMEEELSDIKPDISRYAVILPRSVKKDEYIHLSQLPEHIRNAIGYKIEKGKIAVVYVDEVKGIEFDVVYAVQNGMTKNEKYIAFTRALSELIIVTDNSISPASIDTALSEIGNSQTDDGSTLPEYEGIVIGKVLKKNNKTI